MSWQLYIDSQLINTGMVEHAVIAGLDGSIWAKSTDFEPQVSELRTISDNFDDVSKFASEGIIVGGTKYLYISSRDHVIRGKKDKNGIHIMKTSKALLVCSYKDPVQPNQTAMVTEKLGEYLISVGY